VEDVKVRLEFDSQAIPVVVEFKRMEPEMRKVTVEFSMVNGMSE
jgi:hypothetical protein